MKKIIILILITNSFWSCKSVNVAVDYDKEVDFSNYKTYAFFKPGIDKVELNSLDKKRILRAIESALTSKGMAKSKNPDVLVNFFTKSNKNVDVHGPTMTYGFGFNYGFGINPWFWNQYNVSSSREGILFIDILDAKNKELIWQGIGTGHLSRSAQKKELRIKEFVDEIFTKFPPEKNPKP